MHETASNALQIENRIVEYVRDAAMIDPAQPIPTDQSLLEAGILDSYGIVDLITFVEGEYALSIADEDITKEKMGSIQKLAHYVCQSKLG